MLNSITLKRKVINRRQARDFNGVDDLLKINIIVFKRQDALEDT